MSTSYEFPVVNGSSPAQLKARFQPRLAEWGIDATGLRLLVAVLCNWLAVDSSEDIPHFRQRHRRDQRKLDELVSRGLVAHSGAGMHYEPKFMAFCLLLAAGNRTAVKLRKVMDRLFVLVKTYLEERPLRQQRSTTQIRQLLPEEQRPLLIPAIKLMAETGLGVSLSSPATPYPDLAFTDAIYRFRSVTQVVGEALENYHGTTSFSFAGAEAESLPFELTRLWISTETHASATKAIANLNTHPDSAVSHARAAIEATFKYVLGPDHPALQKPLPRQAAALRERLQLEEQFAALGSRLVSVTEAIGDIRNHFGDSHGRSEADRGATRAEARLAVGTSLLLCDFLLERWEVVRSVPTVNKKPAH